MFNFIKSTVGLKYIMGLTGLIWAGFVFGHMAGNMLIFVSKDAYNLYGHAITSGLAIYAIETLLLSALVVHIVCAVVLTVKNRNSRPARYAVIPNGDKGSRLAARTMAFQGSVVLFFIITHLITFKFGTVYMTTIDGLQVRDLARLLIEVFQQPLYIFWYIVSLLVLMAHLSHGVGSIFQSFGLLERKYQVPIKKLSWTYAIVVTLGFLSQPIYVFLMNK